MGWGMAKNAVEKGWPLRVVAHRKREAVDDLVARGARVRPAAPAGGGIAVALGPTGRSD
jgi:3-hydroxyisobutyrate dehydrogenase-like beta-hydroxyacid dehydrogenase